MQNKSRLIYTTVCPLWLFKKLIIVLGKVNTKLTLSIFKQKSTMKYQKVFVK